MTGGSGELFIGAYVRRSGEKVRVYRVNGTHVFRAYVNGVLAAEGTRRAAMAAAK